MSKIQLPTVPKPEPKPKLICPDPMIDLLSGPFNHDPSEFSSQQLSLFNGGVPKKNSFSLFTAIWKRKRPCCQVLKAEVTIKLKALSGGANPPTSSDAGNDTFNFVKSGGLNIKGFKIYTPPNPFSAGTTVTKTFALTTPSELSWLNATNKLSFLVQDDTEVINVKVKLTVCCLNELEK